MNTIRKLTMVNRNRNQRMTIKGFKSRDAMHKFLNKQPNNDWVVTSEPDYYGAFNAEYAKLKPGVYAYAGSQWHNVKSLDACILSHI